MKEERGGMNAFRTQNPSIVAAATTAAAAIVAASENFMSLSPIGGELFIRMGRFAFLRRN